MSKEEFFKWLNTCPSHKWNTTIDEHGYITVDFTIDEEEDDDNS